MRWCESICSCLLSTCRLLDCQSPGGDSYVLYCVKQVSLSLLQQQQEMNQVKRAMQTLFMWSETHFIIATSGCMLWLLCQGDNPKIEFTASVIMCSITYYGVYWRHLLPRMRWNCANILLIRKNLQWIIIINICI